MFNEDIIENIQKSRLKGNIKIYFAHTLSTRNYVAKELIPKFTREGFLVVNPFVDRLDELKDFTTEEELRKKLKYSPTFVIQHDLTDINLCDCMIVYNPEKPSYGSNYESGYAWLIRKIPIFFIVPKKYLFHPWLNFIGSMVVEEKDINLLIEKMKLLFHK